MPEARGDEERFVLGVCVLFNRRRSFGLVSLAGVSARGCESEAEFDSRFSVSRPREDGAASRVTELETGLGRVADAAHVLAHERREAVIDEGQDRFVAAKIIGKRQHLPARARRAPDAGVAQEDVRAGQPEAIDALLDVANEEPVGRRSVATDRGNDAVLRFIDVLILVHEHGLEAFAPVAGSRRRRLGRRIPEQTQRKLFEVAEIKAGALPFSRGKLSSKLTHQTEQGEGVRLHQREIVRQRVVAGVGHGGQGRQCRSFIEHREDWVTMLALVPFPMLVRSKVCELSSNLTDLGSCKRFAGLEQQPGATVGDLVFNGLVRQLFQPAGLGGPKFIHQGVLPGGAIELRPGPLLPLQPRARLRQCLEMMMERDDQRFNSLGITVAMQADEFEHRLAARTFGLEVAINHLSGGFLRQQFGFAFVQHLRLRIEPQLVEMIAHQSKTEAMQGSNARLVQQRKLFGNSQIGGFLVRPAVQRLPNTPTHFSRCCLCKRHHEELVDGDGIAVREQLGQAPGHQRAGLARARARFEQDVAAGGEGGCLGWGKRVHVGEVVAASSGGVDWLRPVACSINRRHSAGETSLGTARPCCSNPGKFHRLGKSRHCCGLTGCTRQSSPSRKTYSPLVLSNKARPRRSAVRWVKR